MFTQRRLLASCVAAAVALALGQAVRADTPPTTITVAGSTLFQNFFKGGGAASSTNDFIDANSDGLFNYQGAGTWSVEQLAPVITFGGNGSTATYQASSGLVIRTPDWNVAYRSIGSVNGLHELLNTGDGQANPFASTPVGQVAGVWVNTTQVVNTGNTLYPNSSTASGLPAAISAAGTDIAVLDVTSKWGLQAAGTPAWNNRPTQAGYGTNSVASLPSASGTWSNMLVSRTVSGGAQGTVTFNSNPQGSYNAQTLFDTPIAIAPISVVANPGVGQVQFKATDLQTLYVTGRLPNGENLQAQTRSIGSGTRNGFANSLGVDPSFASGENIGAEATGPTPTSLGANYQPTNYSGTGDMENGVRNARLGVGYVGTDTVASDAVAKGYGAVQVAFNLNDSTNNNYVSPNLNTLINNNATGGWLMGGTETMVTIGDPNATAWAGQTQNGYVSTTNPAMANSQAALYVRNITSSINEFVAANATSSDFFMPGQYLGSNFLLTAVPTNVQNATDGTVFSANPNLNTTLQNYELNLPALQAKFNDPLVNTIGAGEVPFRAANAGGYSDGSTTGQYRYFDASSTSSTDYRFAGGPTTVVALNARNTIAGDFNGTGVRDINQIPAMMAAVANPTLWAYNNRDTVNAGALAGTASPIPEILGDFNGDGNFDAQDVRYFADGLAIQTSGPNAGHVDRNAAFTAVDNNWTVSTAGHPAGNYFNTTLATGKPYIAGASRGDIAGSATGPSAGGAPTGADGVVNAKDIDYVISQIKAATGFSSVVPVGAANANGTADSMGQFSTLLTRAITNPSVNVRADFSADMTGDGMINKNDLTDLVTNVLGTQYGDANLDGKVDGSDLSLVLANFGKPNVGWAGGDFLGTPTVDGSDLSLILANFNFGVTPGIAGPGAVATPEPASLAVSGIGALLLLRRRRRA